ARQAENAARRHVVEIRRPGVLEGCLPAELADRLVRHPVALEDDRFHLFLLGARPVLARAERRPRPSDAPRPPRPSPARARLASPVFATGRTMSNTYPSSRTAARRVRSAGIESAASELAIAVSGSLRPWPVSVRTSTSRGRRRPLAPSF